jgi:hypothetical protein
MYHQFKSLLITEEKKDSNKIDQGNNRASIKNKPIIKKATDEDEWEDY